MSKNTTNSEDRVCINPDYSLMQAKAERNVLLIAKFESAMKSGQIVRII